MAQEKYDIFISYRRATGKNYARIIKPELVNRGYRVFLDFDELKDGVFDQRIKDAISDAPIFMMILSEGALDRCVNEGDWVREEILHAEKTKRHIVPVEVDKKFREIPPQLPEDIKAILGAHQFSQIDTETLLQVSIDKMVQDRIDPYLTHPVGKASTPEGTPKGAEIHFTTDTKCNLYRFSKFLLTLQTNQDNVVYLMPGKHKLTFVSTLYDDIKKSQTYSVPSENYSDIIEVSLKKEELLRKAKEEAKRKAEEELRRAREEKQRKEAEERRKTEEQRKREEERRRLLEQARLKEELSDQMCKAPEETRERKEENRQYKLEEVKSNLWKFLIWGITILSFFIPFIFILYLNSFSLITIWESLDLSDFIFGFLCVCIVAYIIGATVYMLLKFFQQLTEDLGFLKGFLIWACMLLIVVAAVWFFKF